MIIKPIILFLLFLVCIPVEGQNPDALKLRSAMIWDAATVLPDTVPMYSSYPVSVGFRKQFTLPEIPTSAALQIFADARYLLWINGEYIARGPNRFDPKRVEYDSIQVATHLRKGVNSIAVLVQSGLSNYRFIYHKPGLGVLLVAQDKNVNCIARIETDTSWRCNSSTRFGKPVVLLSGITDRVDEHLEKEDWLNPEFNDQSWGKAAKIDGSYWGEFCPRMIPMLRENAIKGAKILKITRGSVIDSTQQLADLAMPLVLTAPANVLIDAGQMVRAWLELDFESFGESHVELIPRQSFTNRTAEFLGSCHYQTTGQPGLRKYMTTDDYTCRLINIKLHTGRIKINGFKIVERRYPFDRIGSFRCNDEFLNQLWEMSMRTSEVNATDGYIDGSEGGEWVTGLIDYPVTEVAFAGPGKNGKLIYSDMRLLGNQISRMALSQEGDELIKGWHPSDWQKAPRGDGRTIHNYIEDSSPSWVNLLRIYFDGTGDRKLVEREWPVLEKIIKWFLDRRTDRGLVMAREFYLHFDNPVAFNFCEGATLNAIVNGALIDAAWLAEKLGKKDQEKQFSEAAAKLKEAYNKYLWDDSSGTYYAGLKEGEKKLLTPWPYEPWKVYFASIDQKRESFPPTVQAAVMALSRKLVPENHLSSVRKFLFDHHNEFVSPLSYLYAFEAFYRMNTDETDQEVINTMRKRWAVMVGRKMPGTLGEQFDDKSYYCHDFGPIPSAFLSSYVLGVRRDGPIGNKRIIIEPRLGDLTEAEGTVVTRFGPVPVKWKRRAVGGIDFIVTIPDGVTAAVSIPRPSDKPLLTIDGKSWSKPKPTTRFLQVELGPGKHSGTIIP